MNIDNRGVESFPASGETDWIKLGLAVSAMAAYVLAFVPPFTPDEYRIAELAATPIVVSAWLFGFRGGTVAAITLIPFNAFLFALVTGQTFGAVMGQVREEEMLPAILLVVLGSVLGGLRDIARQARRERAARTDVEEAHRRSEDRFRFVADHVSDGIVTLDRDRRVVSANRAAGTIFGVPVAEMVGRPFATLIPDRGRQDHDAALARYLDAVATTGAEHALRLTGIGERQREFTLEVSFTAPTGESGRLFTGVVREVGRDEWEGRGEEALLGAPGFPLSLQPADGSEPTNEAWERVRPRAEGSRARRMHGGAAEPAGWAIPAGDAVGSDDDVGSSDRGPAGAGVHAAAGRCVILYIEDDRTCVQRVKSVLARKGMELLSAPHGQLGLDVAREREPDLILLDLNLPDVHGSEVLRRIREDPSISRTPVVVLGADVTASQVELLLEAGAQACLPKPVDAPELLRVLGGILDD